MNEDTAGVEEILVELRDALGKRYSEKAADAVIRPFRRQPFLTMNLIRNPGTNTRRSHWLYEMATAVGDVVAPLMADVDHLRQELESLRNQEPK